MPSFHHRLRTYVGIYFFWLLLLFALTGGFSNMSDWFGSWSKWDAEWYLKIWNEGYPVDHPKALNFPPGYSLLIGLLSEVSRIGFDGVAMLVNTAAWFMTLVLAVEVLCDQFSLQRRWPLFVLSLTIPPGYLVLSAYSDFLFAVMLWTAIYLALKRPNELRARIGETILLVLIPWVRLTGYALMAWIVLRRWWASAIYISLAGWLALNKIITGDFFYFLHSKTLFSMPQGGFLTGAVTAFGGLLTPFRSGATITWTDYMQFNLLPSAYFIALVLSCGWFFYRRQYLIGVTLAGIGAVSHNFAFWLGAVRYDMPLITCFFLPLFYYLEKQASSRSASITTVALLVIGFSQFALQVYFAQLFQAGRWGGN